MNTLTEKQKSALIDKLKDIGIDMPKVENIANIMFPVLLIIDYAPQDGRPQVSFALSLKNFPDGPLESKCWITEQNVKPINGEGPQSHSEYDQFEHKKRVFYPFSINPAGYSFQATSILDLINTLYEHTQT